MKNKEGIKRAAFVAAAVSQVGRKAGASSADDLEKAFAALRTYTWGSDRNLLAPIDRAVTGSWNDRSRQSKLEKRLAALLSEPLPDAAKDYICRQLRLIGTAACVSALSELLTNEKLCEIARYALERIPAQEALQAMRQAAEKVEGRPKIGLINSLGVRRDRKALPLLGKLLGSGNQQVVEAAAAALGSIGTPESARMLQEFRKKAPKELAFALGDALLVCAERLLADGKRSQAERLYGSLVDPSQPDRIRRAAVAALRRLRRA